MYRTFSNCADVCQVCQIDTAATKSNDSQLLFSLIYYSLNKVVLVAFVKFDLIKLNDVPFWKILVDWLA